MRASKRAAIAAHGVIGNARTAALVSTSGMIDWCCLPRFDAPSVFGGILDDDACGGEFTICPIGRFGSHQCYVPDSNVLETRFRIDMAEARLLDCFMATNESDRRSRLLPDTEILRILECTRGEMRFALKFSPRPFYGKQRLQPSDRNRWGICYDNGNELLVLQGEIGGKRIFFDCDERGEASTEFTLRSGERACFSCAYDDDAPAVFPLLGDRALERMNTTIAYWRNWLSTCKYRGEFHEQVKRSALALRLLSYAPSGAVVAAVTTSLPEWPGAFRNWDYRFCWLRDSSLTVRALTSLGFLDEARAYVTWLLHSTRLSHPQLQILYSVFGERDIGERQIHWLSGFRDSRPVRVGNEASVQHQLDVYGEVIDSVNMIEDFLNDIDRDTREMVLRFAEFIHKNWNQPDSGIWEMRTQPRHYVHSKAMAWTGLMRTATLARKYQWKAPFHDYFSTAAKIRREIEAFGFDASLNSYVRSFGEREIDASLLVLPIVGYCDASCPRMLATIGAIQRNLSRNGLIYRYRPTSDGMLVPEGAFGLCNFWMAHALTLAGRTDEARYWIEQMVSRLPSTGLWSEEIDPDTGEFLGNFPQAFSHIGLINAALALNAVSQGAKAA